MQRLFGTHNKGTHVKAVDSDNDGSPPTLCDRMIFFTRIGIFIAAIVSGALIASPSHSLLINGHCYATMQTGPGASSSSMSVTFGSDMTCVALRMWGVATATFAGLLLLVCLYNVHAVRLRAQATWTAKLELLMKVLVTISAGIITGFACARAHNMCKDAMAHVTSDSCASALHTMDTSPALCGVCGQDGLFEGILKTLDFVRNCAFASMIAWGLLLVVAFARHIRAKQRMAEIERARLLDEEEMRKEFERRKEEERKTKEAGKGEGKGFVYRMLM